MPGTISHSLDCDVVVIIFIIFPKQFLFLFLVYFYLFFSRPWSLIPKGITTATATDTTTSTTTTAATFIIIIIDIVFVPQYIKKQHHKLRILQLGIQIRGAQSGSKDTVAIVVILV